MDFTTMQTRASAKGSGSIVARLAKSISSSIRSRQQPEISAPKRTVISSPPQRQALPPPTFDLETRAVDTLTSLYSSPSTPSTPDSDTLISPIVRVERDDSDAFTSRVEFHNSWSRQLESMPDFALRVIETIADDSQYKVLVRAELTGLPDGRRRESVEMMTFDADGVLVSTSGCWRTLPERGDEAD